MSEIGERFSKLTAKGNLSATEKELVQIITRLDERLRKLEDGASSSGPIESSWGKTAPQSR